MRCPTNSIVYRLPLFDGKVYVYSDQSSLLQTIRAIQQLPGHLLLGCCPSALVLSLWRLDPCRVKGDILILQGMLNWLHDDAHGVDTSHQTLNGLIAVCLGQYA